MGRQLDSLRTFVGDRPPAAWRRVPHVVIVASGKGGTGTTTAAALVAAGAARRGRSTLLVDATAGAASAGALLGGDADAQPRLIAPNLTLVPVPGPHELGGAERRALLRRLSGRYGAHELVVVDAGATCDGVAAALSAGAGRLLAVAVEDRVTLAATFALVKFVLERFERLPVSVLVNRSTPADATTAFGRIATAVEQFLAASVQPAGSLPQDDGLADAVEAGLSPIDHDGPAVHAAGLLSELLLHAGGTGHGRPVSLQA